MPVRPTPVVSVSAPDATDVHVGAQLKAARLENGMSQRQLGEVAGVSFQQMQKYEKGTNRVASSTLQKFAAAMNVPIDRFFPDRPNAGTQFSSGSNAGYIAASAEGAAELLRLYEGLGDPAARQQLIQLARLLDGNRKAKPRSKPSK